MSEEVIETLVRRDDSPRDVSPGALIRFAIENKIDPASLKELVHLSHMMQDRDAAKEFAAAKMRFKKACPSIQKNKKADIMRKNEGFSHSYHYADLQEIVRIVDPFLAAEGLDYSWDSEDSAGKLKVTFILKHVNGHSEKSNWTTTTETNAGMSAQQKVAAAFTFGRRQTMVAGLGLTTTDPDTDGAAKDNAGLKPITEHQAANLEALLSETGANRAGFLKAMQSQTVSSIPSFKFMFATQILEAKRGGQKK